MSRIFSAFCTAPWQIWEKDWWLTCYGHSTFLYCFSISGKVSLFGSIERLIFDVGITFAGIKHFFLRAVLTIIPGLHGNDLNRLKFLLNGKCFVINHWWTIYEVVCPFSFTLLPSKVWNELWFFYLPTSNQNMDYLHSYYKFIEHEFMNKNPVLLY